MTPPAEEAFLVAIPGLEEVVAEEAREILGAGAPVEPLPGGVGVRLGRPALRALLLRTRTASGLLIRAGELKARSFAELERRAAAVDRVREVAAGRPVVFEITSRKSRLYHTGAIEERLRRVLGVAAPEARAGAAAAGADSAETALAAAGPPPLRVVVRAVRDHFTVSLDAVGEPWHRRGWRLRTAKAPLRETIAAALLRISGWTGETPLADPFCGAGTIPIEGALIARGVAPGLQRTFDLEGWPDADAEAWRAERAHLRERALPGPFAPILGSDRDAGAIEASVENAERAGVADQVEFVPAALSNAPIPKGAGVVSNLPWGHRIQGGELRNLHARLGAVLRDRAVERVVLLSDSRRLDRETGLDLERLARFRAGGIDVIAWGRG